MSTPAARRDQDARSARRLGYVNNYSLRPMKQTPTGSQGRDPGRRAADQQNGATGHGHTTTGQEHRPNSLKLEALNVHRNQTRADRRTNNFTTTRPSTSSASILGKKSARRSHLLVFSSLEIFNR